MEMRVSESDMPDTPLLDKSPSQGSSLVLPLPDSPPMSPLPKGGDTYDMHVRGEDTYNTHESGGGTHESSDPSNHAVHDTTPSTQKWSSCHKPTVILREYMESLGLAAATTEHQVEGEILHREDTRFLDSMGNPLAFINILSDTMYLDQAMKEPDAAEFERAMLQEVKMHEDRKHWEVVSIATLEPGVKLLKSVWAMQQKRCINTGEIYKYKARSMPMGDNKSMVYTTGKHTLPCKPGQPSG